MRGSREQGQARTESGTGQCDQNSKAPASGNKCRESGVAIPSSRRADAAGHCASFEPGLRGSSQHHSLRHLPHCGRAAKANSFANKLTSGSSALPGKNTAFLLRALAMSVADRISASTREGWVFFDRGLMDAAVGRQHLTGEKAPASLGPTHRFHQRVFLTPPWPEIYLTEPGAASWIGLRCDRAIGDLSRFTVACL